LGGGWRGVDVEAGVVCVGGGAVRGTLFITSQCEFAG